MFYWFGLLIVLQVSLVLAAALGGGLDPSVTQLLVGTAVVGSKLGIDRTLLVGRRNGAGRFSRWFVPEEPTAG